MPTKVAGVAGQVVAGQVVAGSRTAVMMGSSVTPPGVDLDRVAASMEHSGQQQQQPTLPQQQVGIQK